MLEGRQSWVGHPVVVGAGQMDNTNLSNVAAVVPAGGVTATTADVGVVDPATRATLGALRDRMTEQEPQMLEYKPALQRASRHGRVCALAMAA